MASTGAFVVRRLPFATTPGRRGVRRSFEAAADIELVDLNRACERRFPRHHQPQSVSYTLGGDHLAENPRGLTEHRLIRVRLAFETSKIHSRDISLKGIAKCLSR